MTRDRNSGARRTRTLRVSPLGSIQSPASIPANAGLIDENKRQTAWLEKIFENTKPKKDVKPNLEAIFA